MMRRSSYILMFVLVLVAPLLARWAIVPARDRMSDVGSAARRLVIITPNNQDIRREFAAAFNRWYQAKYGAWVTLDYRTPGGTTDIERQLKSSYAPYRDAAGHLPAGVPADIDIVWGGGDYTFNQVLKPAGLLQQIELPSGLLAEAFPEQTLAGVRLYDPSKNAEGAPAPLWIGVCLSSFGIVYNPQVYELLSLPAPRSWADLTSPRLAGMISLADPGHSGSAAVAYMMVLQRSMADAEEDIFRAQPALRQRSRAQLAGNADYQQAISRGWKRGMGQLVLIAANARYFTDSSEIVPNDVSRGDAAAGMAIDFYARVTEQVVGSRRAQFVLPRGATAITPDPVGILVGVRDERLTLARRFVEYLLSPEGQRLWILKVGAAGGPIQRALWRMPIRRDVYANPQDWEETVNPFKEAGGFNQRPEWMRLLGDTRTVWGAAWIDSRDALLDAYDDILRVSDQTRRAALLTELSEAPISMGDVLKMSAQRKQVAPDNLDEWNARERIDLGNLFRSHYRSVAASASRRP